MSYIVMMKEVIMMKMVVINAEESDDDIPGVMHPLDLIYAIFLCADDFLKTGAVR